MEQLLYLLAFQNVSEELVKTNINIYHFNKYIKLKDIFIKLTINEKKELVSYIPFKDIEIRNIWEKYQGLRLYIEISLEELFGEESKNKMLNLKS